MPVIPIRHGQIAFLLTMILSLAACNRTTPPTDNAESATTTPTHPALAGTGGTTPPSRMSPPPPIAADRSSADRPGADRPGADRSSADRPGADQPVSLRADQANLSGSPTRYVARSLPAGLSTPQLREFLSGADVDLRLIASGQADMGPDEQLAAAREIVTLKRVASQRLVDHPVATAKERAIGNRGLLQSLSHLASLGDLAAADELQSLAQALHNDPDADLRADSQLVLIGFAIERLRHGKPSAAEKLVSTIRDLAEQNRSPDVASLMVMGQAMDALVQYGHVEEAVAVRRMIQTAFDDHPDANVASMMRQIVGEADSGGAVGEPMPGAAEITAMERLRLQMMAQAGGTTDELVDDGQWRRAMTAMIERVPDLQTVRFLAGLSLQAEMVGRQDLATSTYMMLKTYFADDDGDLGREARTALRARENRREVLGKRIDPDYPSVSGRPIRMGDYRGKIVLLIFWSAEYPDSLAPLNEMRAIAQRHPDQVALVGINLDVAGADVADFMSENGLDFPSFRCPSNPTETIVNEVSYQFGHVTLQFVAVLDAEGRVAAIDFSGRSLAEEVAKLLR